MEKKVLIITMGGTISGKVATTKRKGEIIKTSDQFKDVLSDACASIKSTTGTEVILEHMPLCDKDSSDVSPDEWKSLAELIRDNYDGFDSFIITHGTNTMGYTAAALSFSLPNLDKPVIITGSQVPAGMPGSDAIMNLENALRLALLEKSGEKIKGVLAVFGSYIITGTRVKKSTEFDYDAVKSFGRASIGRIGRIIDIDETNLAKHNGYLKTNLYQPAKKAKDLLCYNNFDMRIASLTEFPGMNVEILETLVEQKLIKAVILRAFGAGDAANQFIPTLTKLKDQKIPVVITTQAPNGNSNFQVNEPGQHIAEAKLAIPAYNMSIESQTVKLAWLLYKMENGKDKISYDQLCEQMINDIRGEVDVVWEVKM